MVDAVDVIFNNSATDLSSEEVQSALVEILTRYTSFVNIINTTLSKTQALLRGNGVPTFPAPRGTQYIDNNTGIRYEQTHQVATTPDWDKIGDVVSNALDLSKIPFEAGSSGLTSTNLNDVIFEIHDITQNLESINIGYDNTDSGMAAGNVKAALDELKTEINNFSGAGGAVDIDYDNTGSELIAVNVQAAIDEIKSLFDNFAASVNAIDINYNNTSSGLASDNIQAVIDEIDGIIDSLIITLNNIAAIDIDYDNTISGLVATNVKTAIDEIVSVIETLSSDAIDIDYDNTTSLLVADNLQDAVDELKTAIDNISPITEWDATPIVSNPSRIVDFGIDYNSTTGVATLNGNAIYGGDDLFGVGIGAYLSAAILDFSVDTVDSLALQFLLDNFLDGSGAHSVFGAVFASDNVTTSSDLLAFILASLNPAAPFPAGSAGFGASYNKDQAVITSSVKGASGGDTLNTNVAGIVGTSADFKISLGSDGTNTAIVFDTTDGTTYNQMYINHANATFDSGFTGLYRLVIYSIHPVSNTGETAGTIGDMATNLPSALGGADGFTVIEEPADTAVAYDATAYYSAGVQTSHASGNGGSQPNYDTYINDDGDLTGLTLTTYPALPAEAIIKATSTGTFDPYENHGTVIRQNAVYENDGTTLQELTQKLFATPIDPSVDSIPSYGIYESIGTGSLGTPAVSLIPKDVFAVLKDGVTVVKLSNNQSLNTTDNVEFVDIKSTGKLLRTYTTIAATAGDKDTATQITSDFVNVTATVDDDGVKLPVAKKGMKVMIGNISSYNVLVYPSSGESFSGFGADLPQYLYTKFKAPDGAELVSVVYYLCATDGVWSPIPAIGSFLNHNTEAFFNSLEIKSPLAQPLDFNVDLTGHTAQGSLNLTATMNVVTTAAENEAATLPIIYSDGVTSTTRASKVVYVYNNTLNTIRVYAVSGTALDGQYSYISIPPNKLVTFKSVLGTSWESDLTTSTLPFVLDEDNMASNSDAKVPTQQSVKAYVDSSVASSIKLQGGYDASTDTPSLDDGTPIAGIKKGDHYVVTVAGTFFSSDVEVGDSLIAEQDSPTLESHWIITQANLIDVVLKSNTSTASMQFVVDEDDMVSDLATKVPTQQSVKAYVDDKNPELTLDNTLRTSSFTTVAGNRYYFDFSPAGGTATLPLTPTVGDTVELKDINGTLDTGVVDLTLGRNGENIMGSAADYVLSDANALYRAKFVGGTTGWAVYVISEAKSVLPIVLAKTVGNTRTQALYSPAAQAAVALSSDLDIVITHPTGTTKALLHWEIMGDVSTGNGRTGFVVYKDVDGGGFNLLPNSRDGGENYYSVITTYVYDTNTTTTPSTTSISIIDESPDIGAVTTYRVYVANTSSSVASDYSLNKAINAVGSETESGLSTFWGESLC